MLKSTPKQTVTPRVPCLQQLRQLPKHLHRTLETVLTAETEVLLTDDPFRAFVFSHFGVLAAAGTRQTSLNKYCNYIICSMTLLNLFRSFSPRRAVRRRQLQG